jgi:DUF971 family protein
MTRSPVRRSRFCCPGAETQGREDEFHAIVVGHQRVAKMSITKVMATKNQEFADDFPDR